MRAPETSSSSLTATDSTCTCTYGIIVCKVADIGGRNGKDEIKYELTTDNWYTSLAISLYLDSIGTAHTGTIRRTQAEGYPKALQKKRLKVGEKIAFRKGKVLAIVIRDKKKQVKPLLMTSTKYSACFVDKNGIAVRKGDHKEGKKYKCQLVHAYNHTKYGIDKSDEVMYFYEVERKSRRWPVKVILRLMQKALLTSFLLYKCVANKPMKRIRFYIKAFDGLMNPLRNK